MLKALNCSDQESIHVGVCYTKMAVLSKRSYEFLAKKYIQTVRQSGCVKNGASQNIGTESSYAFNLEMYIRAYAIFLAIVWRI